ncbi:hypothetical protein SAY86_004761 [Trapa natans]|uniref:Ribosomal protein S11 n=1 Tax=Trapa natans TaxID=22666 RepID=A0AAN7MGN8_TRANT|nr:hypothetical protein SAY86_004761 [Trapa natans]
MSSSMNGQAQSLISLLSAKSRAQPLVNSSFRSYAGLATKSDSLGYSRIHKLAGYLFHYSTNPKINVCLPALCSRRLVHSSAPKDLDQGMDYRSMNFVRGVIEEDRRGGIMNNFQFPHHNVEQDVDFVHIKLMRNNTFVTVTDSKGNKKIGASSGCLSEMKGGPKASRYAAEATAEHVGRMSRNIGRKSIVMRVKGFTFFKKKRQAIMSWREGFTNSKVEQNRNSPVVYIEDATRRPHNGCRLPRKRRV